MTFNYGLLLMVGGALVMLYKNVKDEHPHQIFALVWSLIMLVSTWQHVRYEYYLAVNVALLSAVCISFTFEQDGRIFAVWQHRNHQILKPRKSIREKRSPPEVKNRKNSRRKDLDPLNRIISAIALVILTVGLGILFAYTSASLSYSNASSDAIRMNPDWRESLDWMANNTPDNRCKLLHHLQS